MNFAVLLAGALCAVVTGCLAYSTVPLSEQPYRKNMDALQFLKHVLAHEREWKLVLQERVKNLPAPPHRDRFVDEVIPRHLLDAPGTVFDTKKIVSDVLRKYSTVGSFVEWAAGVLHKSLMCYTARHLALKSHYLSRMFEMKVETGVAFSALRAMKNVVVMFIDKLALMPADLELVSDTYWEVIGLMQNSVVLNVRPVTFPPEAQQRMDTLHARYLAVLDAECTEFRLTKELFADMGMDSSKLMFDNVLRLVIGPKGLTRLGAKHTRFLEEYFKNLGYETLPKSLWGQAFYSATDDVPDNDKPDETNGAIMVQPTVQPYTHELVIEEP